MPPQPPVPIPSNAGATHCRASWPLDHLYPSLPAADPLPPPHLHFLRPPYRRPPLLPSPITSFPWQPPTTTPPPFPLLFQLTTNHPPPDLLLPQDPAPNAGLLPPPLGTPCFPADSISLPPPPSPDHRCRTTASATIPTTVNPLHHQATSTTTILPTPRPPSSLPPHPGCLPLPSTPAPISSHLLHPLSRKPYTATNTFSPSTDHLLPHLTAAASPQLSSAPSPPNQRPSTPDPSTIEPPPSNPPPFASTNTVALPSPPSATSKLRHNHHHHHLAARSQTPHFPRALLTAPLR